MRGFLFGLSISVAFIVGCAGASRNRSSAIDATKSRLTILMESPLYRLAAAEHGLHVSASEDGRGAHVDFSDKSTLKLSASPEIEYFAYELQGGAGGDTAALLSTLKELETYAVGAGGCGMRWPSTIEAGATTVFEGDACNCKASLTWDGDTIAIVRFSAAC